MAKKKNIRPNAGEELLDVDSGVKACRDLAEQCGEALETYDRDLDGYQESTLGKAKEFAESVEVSIETRGVYTEGQQTAVNKWKASVDRVVRQLEEKRR